MEKLKCEGFHWFPKEATGYLERTLVTTTRTAVCNKHKEIFTKQYKEFEFKHPSYAGELTFIPLNQTHHVTTKE